MSFLAKIKSQIQRCLHIVNQRILLVQRSGLPDVKCSVKDFLFHNYDGLTETKIRDIRSLKVGDWMHLGVGQGWVKVTRQK